MSTNVTAILIRIMWLNHNGGAFTLWLTDKDKHNVIDIHNSRECVRESHEMYRVKIFGRH